MSQLPVFTVKMRVSSLSRGLFSSNVKTNVWPLRTTSSGPGYSLVRWAAQFLSCCQSTLVTLTPEQGEDSKKPSLQHIPYPCLICPAICFGLPVICS